VTSRFWTAVEIVGGIPGYLLTVYVWARMRA
jgi:hypothetical protein